MSSFGIPFRDALVAKGFRVVSFDMLGQGISDKPRLFIEPRTTRSPYSATLIAELGRRADFLAGISFGGVIALRYAIAHGDTIAGLVPMLELCRVAAAAVICLGSACAPA